MHHKHFGSAEDLFRDIYRYNVARHLVCNASRPLPMITGVEGGAKTVPLRQDTDENSLIIDDGRGGGFGIDKGKSRLSDRSVR